MEKYVVGLDMHGYDKLEIDDAKLRSNIVNVTIVLDENSTKPLKDYYNTISAVLRMGGNVNLISIGDKSDKFKPLASLMTTYRNYNIYKVTDRESITASYLKKIESRKPSFDEVQTYIGGDVAAYSEMSTLMIGIENLVEQGDMNGLSSFLEQHMSSIESLTSALDYMKTICELNNSSELLDKINDLEEVASKNKANAEASLVKINELQTEKAKIKAEVESLSKSVEALKNKNEQLKDTAENGGSIITSFRECNTSMVQCKVKNIIYFKEISYVPYMNTLINTLFDLYTMKGKKVKLIIYDNKTEYYQIYAPLTIVNGKNYLANKSNILKDTTPKFVVSEPVPMIINDIITVEPTFDIVMVYDRMKCKQDVVIGNNVAKFFVIGSYNEYCQLSPILNIADESHIITRYDKRFSTAALDIPKINVENATGSAKKMKYFKLATTFSDGTKNLIQDINAKARIDL